MLGRKEVETIKAAQKDSLRVTNLIDKSKELKGKEVSGNRHSIEYKSATDALEIADEERRRLQKEGSSLDYLVKFRPEVISLYRDRLNEERRKRVDNILSKIEFLNKEIKGLEFKKITMKSTQSEEAEIINEDIKNIKSEIKSLNLEMNKLFDLV